MRKVTFVIDDIEYFRNLYKDQLTEKQFNEIKNDLKSFKAVYTLIGNQNPDRYILTTPEGDKLNINDLNGYQRGCVLNDCHAYYNGKRDFEGNGPCGVVEIKEEEV